jgi:NADPH:quinone reductase-like Zn-dependent oxidoreductase
MKAAVINRYGPPDTVRVAEVPHPRPRAAEVLVRVHAVAVTSADTRVRGARFPAGFAPFARLVFGLFRPRRRILGSSFSGVVEAVGSAVTRLQPGDAVCGMTGLKMGAHAEYLTVAAEKLVDKPDAVSHENAAGLLFGGTTALFFLRDKVNVAPGGSVLINGASGAIGTNAVQLAKHFGAVVTGVCSGGNAELVTGLGASRVIDYTRDDLLECPDRFDVVFDTVGSLSIDSGRRLLSDGGVLLLAVANLWETLRARGNVVAATAPERVDDMELLLQMVAGGELTVVVDHVYDFAEVAKAHSRVDTGHKVGNVVLRL